MPTETGAEIDKRELNAKNGIQFPLVEHASGTQVPLAPVVQYVKEIPSALQYAHEQNIIHRDIKPENMLIGRHGELLLSVFGISVLSKTGRTSFQPTSYGIGGTSLYMAPEQFRGKPEKASDQYALGTATYKWLCGTTPFTEGDFIQLGYQHTHEPIPEMRDHLPSLSPRVEAVEMRALAKKPRERFPSVREFAKPLDAASKTPSADIKPISPPGREVAKPLDAASKTPPIGTKLLTYTGHTAPVCSVAWSPNGKWLASASWDRTVQVWDTSSGQLLLTCTGHTDNVFLVAWSPDGKRLASASWDQTVRVWDASNGRLLLTYTGHAANVWSVACSPDGKRLASTSNEMTVQVWDASSGQLLLTCTGHNHTVTSVAWSPDGQRLASASFDKTVQVWDASSGGLLLTCTGHTDNVWLVAWSPDGKRLASASDDKTVQVWDASSSRKLLTNTGHTATVRSVAWSPDGKRLASASNDKTVQVWQAI